MGNITVSQYSITIPAQIGEITEKKKEKISEYITNNSNMKINFNTPFGFIFISQNNEENMLLNIDRIAYTKIGYNCDEAYVNKILEGLVDILMLDENVFGIIDIQAYKETEDAFKETIELYNSKFNNSLASNNQIYGVGFRYFSSSENSIGELKIEPLLTDPKKYFYQLIDNYNKTRILYTELIKETSRRISNINEIFKDLKIN